MASELDSWLDQLDAGVDEEERRRKALEESRKRRQAIVQKYSSSQSPATPDDVNSSLPQLLLRKSLPSIQTRLQPPRAIVHPTLQKRQPHSRSSRVRLNTSVLRRMTPTRTMLRRPSSIPTPTAQRNSLDSISGDSPSLTARQWDEAEGGRGRVRRNRGDRRRS